MDMKMPTKHNKVKIINATFVKFFESTMFFREKIWDRGGQNV